MHISINASPTAEIHEKSSNLIRFTGNTKYGCIDVIIETVPIPEIPQYAWGLVIISSFTTLCFSSIPFSLMLYANADLSF